jgi:hypothetical protein
MTTEKPGAAWPVVTFCARCDAIESAHEIRSDGTRGRRYGQTAGAATNVACPGFTPGRVEERAPEGELRRRLDAVLALHEPIGHPRDQLCPICMDDRGVNAGWPCPTVRAARDES